MSDTESRYEQTLQDIARQREQAAGTYHLAGRSASNSERVLIERYDETYGVVVFDVNPDDAEYFVGHTLRPMVDE